MRGRAAALEVLFMRADGQPRLGFVFLLSVALIGAAFYAVEVHNLLDQLNALLRAVQP